MNLKAVFPILIPVVLLLAGVGPAAAHKLKLFASAVGAEVQGRVYFVGGGPAMDVPVTLSDSGGTVLATTRTAAPDGRFVLTLTYRDDYTLRADGQDGHAASFPLRASRLSDALPLKDGVDVAQAAQSEIIDMDEGVAAVSETSDAVEEAVARQLAPLIDEVNAMRDTIGVRDIVGGIGYIVGVFGLWALLAARRRRP